MTNVQLAIVSWIALLVHVAVGLIAWRRWSELPLVAVVNAIVASGVLVYWGVRWYSYLFRSITWYWSDQWMPLYALIALCVALMALTGRLQIGWPNIVVFALHGAATVLAVLFVSFFRMNRLF